MIMSRLKKVWDVFRGRDPTYDYLGPYGYSDSYRPDRTNYTFVSRRSIVSTVYNRIAVDVSQINLRHARSNEDGQMKEILKTGLNQALIRSANGDQNSRFFFRSLVLTLFDEGCVAIVPTKTDVNPLLTDSFDIEEMRVGKIVQWYPDRIRIDVYRDDTGRHEQIVLPKRIVPIIENPFYEIMNAPNSTLQRLLKTIGQLEDANKYSSAGKLDIVIQLPYSLKHESKNKIAEERKKDIEAQLTNSKYGIAYIDPSEKVIQLNRSLENDLHIQVKELQEELYNQLGLTKTIFDGTASEEERLNYYNTTIEPLVSEIALEMERKWLTKTAISQGQAIFYYRDPFKLIPLDKLAAIGDTLTRNEICTSNEIRSFIGLKPSDDPRANELINSNLKQPNEGQSGGSNAVELAKSITIPDELLNKNSKSEE